MENTIGNRSLARVASSARRPGSWEFAAANVGGAQLGPDMDPVLGIDHFKMRAPVFAPHPHAGFSAVTYLFDNSEGEFVNRDSLGRELLAKPGAIIWTLAGRGLLHEEFPREAGKLAHGLQVFVNLPAADKRQPPRVLFADGPDVPVLERTGVRARVLAGSTSGMRGAFEAPGGLTFLDVSLEPGAGFQHALPRDESTFLYVIEGELRTGDDRALGTEATASFAPDGDAVFVRGGAPGARFVLFAGRPLRERVVARGPFIMNSEAQIQQAIEDYRAGRMGRLGSVHGPA
jgi:redox-sensitive bicupin YhaK (pirin superfamily)